MYFHTAKKIFFDNPILGSGPRTYQFKSRDYKYYTVSNHAALEEKNEKENKIINCLDLHKYFRCK